MSTSYNPSIPNPPDAPSADVPIMQTNAAAISNLIVIDHVGFGRSQSGQHQQVTFAANNVPGSLPSGAQGILYTNLVSSVAQLFFYNGTTTSQLTTNITPIASSNGASYLPGGVIIQWGSGTASAGSRAITFPITFPSNLWSLTVSPNGNSAVGIAWDSQSVNGFTAHTQNSNTFFNWIAIGN